jgi:alanyl-tRNA synthetase
MNKKIPTQLTGNAIRQQFVDFFVEKAGHTFVRSSSLVPGGDSTLLFTNAGMVQFKDVFLGIDQRPYKRAVNFQKCLRVAGKHNDLEDVGQDNTHHTFFEMLGNWSFGDYYKKEAIGLAWELLTEVWGIPKDHLYATVFKDEYGEIPSDEEAAKYWRQQPGFIPDHVFFIGRKDNFWEMADTGPCGPCSEIHIDLHPDEGPVTPEILDTDRFTEIWNLVFIQYNRTGPSTLEPLPETHVDTGMGFERIVNILQGAGSNYRTDLFWPLIQAIQGITEHNQVEIEENFTPYRVIADHARAAAFLIADGVVPGNLGRNYICRMIIRRAFRFAGKIGIDQPFLARIAAVVIELYGEAYPELVQNQPAILEDITREEEQFQRTIDKATTHLATLLDIAEKEGQNSLSGEQTADLYTTYGMPLEITRDIAKERGLGVDEAGFNKAMEAHRLASGAGKAMGELGGEDVEIFRQLGDELGNLGLLPPDGVEYQPYGDPEELYFESIVLAIIKDSQSSQTANPGDTVEVLLPVTHFYLESGGQVADTGTITLLPAPGEKGREDAVAWEIEVTGMRKPAVGIITHVGRVTRGHPHVGDKVKAQVDSQRRADIMRNHTATHLLHAALHNFLGNHARQAGSLVAPDRLRFDFNHPEALSQREIQEIEEYVNLKILGNYPLHVTQKSLDEALSGGAIALFGEKYEDQVRDITIGDENPFSNELCGGTHVDKTGDIGIFIITSESSVAAGIRRIEAVTGREAYKLIQHRTQLLNQTASILGTTPEQTPQKVLQALSDLKEVRNQIIHLRKALAEVEFSRLQNDAISIRGVKLLTAQFGDTDVDSLRQMADQYRQRQPENGIAVLTSISDGRPTVIVAVTKDLVKRGIKAGDLAGFVANQLGGGGGGKPTLAQAGGKDASKLDEALKSVASWVERNLQTDQV